MLPGLVLIADRFTQADVRERVREAVQAGLAWVHLRDHQVSDPLFYDAAMDLVKALLQINAEVMISVNGRPAIARDLALHYHFGAQGPPVSESAGRLNGYSAHALTEIREDKQIDYYFYSPVFPTSSKPGHKGIGVSQLEAFCKAAAPSPVYALGGITPENCRNCIKAGAQGVAVLSGILDAGSVHDAVRAYLDALLVDNDT